MRLDVNCRLFHLAAALLMGLITAFLICALYGTLMRCMSALWLKGLSTWIQLFALAAFIAIPILTPESVMGVVLVRYRESFWNWLPWAWFVQFGLLGVRWALGEFAGEMRWRLHLMKAGTNQMFREIG